MTKNYFSKRTCCPVCSKAEFTVLYEVPYINDGIKHYLSEFYSNQGYIDFGYLEGMTFTLLQCHSCKLIFQNEVPNDELLAILYDQWIDPIQALERNKNHDLDYRVMRFEEALSIVYHLNRKPQQLEVLDFGMGWGNLCVQFKTLGVPAKGLELSIPRKEYAESQGVEVITWEDLDHLKFDFINTDDVFEHLTDPILVLKKLTDSLKPNGIIKISTPNAKVAEHSIKKMNWYAPRGTAENLNAVSPLEHINCFYHETLIKLGALCGLKPVQVKGVEITKKTTSQKLKDLYRTHVLGIKSTSLYFTKF
jgi:2-polyprenyl-3-methyl-5-hydroxy-6-metoxy-1,4-benzoquinol methylase